MSDNMPYSPTPAPQSKIAVIGAGAAGLAAAWLLSRANYAVSLFEAESRPGGHAHTIDLPIPNTNTTIPVDVGFIVYNSTTYPDLVSLFEMLGVEEENSTMSFAASVNLPNGTLFEWGSDSLATLFADRSNLYNTAMYVMLYDMRRFNTAVHHFVHCLNNQPDFAQRNISLAQFLEAGNYSTAFIRSYLVPMISAVWSASFNAALLFPARSLFHFFVNHGLAQVFARPQWRTPALRSRDYVEKLLKNFEANGGHVHLNAPITAVHRAQDHVTLYADAYKPMHFDQVVFATHPPTTLKLLADQATDFEKSILGAFQYSKNTAFIHTDQRMMPTNKAVWSAWNFIGRTPSPSSTDDHKPPPNPDDTPVCVSYWLNKLQNLHKFPAPVPDLFLTLNPITPIDPDKKLAELTFHHPQFTEEAVNAQSLLQSVIQGQNRTWFCGSYARYGFHEDAIMMGLDVAERLSEYTNLRPWRSKHALAINDHTQLYQAPYSTLRTPFFALLGTLFILSTVVYRLQQGLGKIAKRMSDSDPVVVVSAGDGRLHRFGPPRRRRRSRSTGSMGRSDDLSNSSLHVEPQTARVTVKNARVLVRIAESLRRGYELAPTAAAAFAAGELDCPTPEDLTVVLRALFIADGLDLDPSKARKGRAKFAESLLSTIMGGVKKIKLLPTQTRLPELTTCISNVVYPAWWLRSNVDEDEYSTSDTEQGTPATDLRHPANTLEFLGDLSERTVSLLEKNSDFHATIVVRTGERIAFVTRKAELLSVGQQIDIFLLEDFLKHRQSDFGSSASLEKDERLYNLILSPSLLNSFKGTGFGSMDKTLTFLRGLAAPSAVIEVGGSVFGSRHVKASPQKRRGSSALFAGDDDFVLWDTSEILKLTERHGFELQSLSFMDSEEAAMDVCDVTQRVYNSLAPEKLNAEEIRMVLAQMCLWEAALRVKYVRRTALRFKLT